ncbi:MAG: hypothetical protein ACC682_00140 [Gemmatimonadota bacterium]
MTRRFDDREVAEILGKATEPRSSRALSASASAEGLTLAEVKDIALEAGIDPARIEEAANGLVRPVPTSKLDVFVGAPTTVRFETHVRGDLDDDDRAEMVRLIRATLDRQGVVGGQGGTLEWMDQDGLGGCNVTVSPTGDGARVEVVGRFDVAAGGAAGVTGVTGVVGAVGTALVVASTGPVGWLLIPATLVAMVAVPRLTIGARVRRETRKLAELADRLRDAMSFRK